MHSSDTAPETRQAPDYFTLAYRDMTQDALAPRSRLVALVRQVIDQLASTTAGEDVLDKAAASVSEALHTLRSSTHQPGYLRGIEGLLTGMGPHGELGPFTGELHAFAPPFHISRTDEERGTVVTATTRYGNAYEGMPNILQGGFIVATFDEILALAQPGTGRVTGSLQISYRSPAPCTRSFAILRGLIGLRVARPS